MAPDPPIPLSFILIEIYAYICGAICLRHAWRTGRWSQVSLLVSAVVLGLIAEFLSVRSDTAYCYGRFLVMLPPGPVPYEANCAVGAKVPLWIGVSWGFIIYGAMHTSTSLAVPWHVRPIIDGVLAGLVDWTLDPVATKMGLWTWFQPGLWFGIPLDNFFAWFVLVAAFSYMVRALRHVVPQGDGGLFGELVVYVGTIENGLLLLYVAGETFVVLAQKGVSQWLLLGLTVGVAIVASIALVTTSRAERPPGLDVTGTAIANQFLALTLLLYSGLARERPVLLAVWAVTFSIALIGFGWPYFRKPRTMSSAA